MASECVHLAAAVMPRACHRWLSRGVAFLRGRPYGCLEAFLHSEC